MLFFLSCANCNECGMLVSNILTWGYLFVLLFGWFVQFSRFHSTYLDRFASTYTSSKSSLPTRAQAKHFLVMSQLPFLEYLQVPLGGGLTYSSTQLLRPMYHINVLYSFCSVCIKWSLLLRNQNLSTLENCVTANW